jgi:AraC family transcriptional regulator, regulatory protein of adaptative response / methylated-DNA-[protein]-cysteine methyltransferase
MAYVRAIAAATESPTTTIDVPMDMRGSEFAKSVWQALRDIPVGSTAIYKQIAQKIGAAVMAKDVGEACAANALAMIVPCHRVVRSAGSLGGS